MADLLASEVFEVVEPTMGFLPFDELQTGAIGVAELFTTSVLPAGSSSPPQITVISPTVGSSISYYTPLVIEVTDDLSSFARIIIVADFGGGTPIRDVVHDGTSFGPAYDSASTRASITNGFRYSIVRNGGWPSSPTITPFAIDSDGGENP